jgi:tetratricopeptide (TPR) repeat protein
MIYGIEMQAIEEMSFEEQLTMLEKYAHLLKENPENEKIYLSNLALMDKVGNVSGALAEYQRIKEKNALHFNNQGVSRMKTYRLTEANEDFLNALRKDDKMAATYFNLAVLYAFRGYTNLVIYNLEKATTLDPSYKKRIFDNPAFAMMANDPKFDKFR